MSATTQRTTGASTRTTWSAGRGRARTRSTAPPGRRRPPPPRPSTTAPHPSSGQEQFLNICCLRQCPTNFFYFLSRYLDFWGCTMQFVDLVKIRLGQKCSWTLQIALGRAATCRTRTTVVATGCATPACPDPPNISSATWVTRTGGPWCTTSSGAAATTTTWPTAGTGRSATSATPTATESHLFVERIFFTKKWTEFSKGFVQLNASFIKVELDLFCSPNWWFVRSLVWIFAANIGYSRIIDCIYWVLTVTNSANIGEKTSDPPDWETNTAQCTEHSKTHTTGGVNIKLANQTGTVRVIGKQTPNLLHPAKA